VKDQLAGVTFQHIGRRQEERAGALGNSIYATALNRGVHAERRAWTAGWCRPRFSLSPNLGDPRQVQSELKYLRIECCLASSSLQWGGSSTQQTYGSDFTDQGLHFTVDAALGVTLHEIRRPAIAYFRGSLSFVIGRVEVGTNMPNTAQKEGSVADRYKRLQRKLSFNGHSVERTSRRDPWFNFECFIYARRTWNGSNRRPGAICQARSQSFKR
jgi:hypothetical protein